MWSSRCVCVCACCVPGACVPATCWGVMTRWRTRVSQLMGGTAASFVCYVCPPAFYLFMAAERGLSLRDRKALAAIALAVTGTVVGAASTIFTVLGLFSTKDTAGLCPVQ